jgi:hypothetical protein
MNEIPWYAEASLVSDAHVFCAGSLAQCVRKWTRLTDLEKATAIIKLGEDTDARQAIGGNEIVALSGNPELTKV